MAEVVAASTFEVAARSYLPFVVSGGRCQYDMIALYDAEVVACLCCARVFRKTPHSWGGFSVTPADVTCSVCQYSQLIPASNSLTVDALVACLPRWALEYRLPAAWRANPARMVTR